MSALIWDREPPELRSPVLVAAFARARIEMPALAVARFGEPFRDRGRRQPFRQ